MRAIAALYAGAQSQLELNGSTGAWFAPTRGVRQGCPLSPLLYALFAEPLGALRQGSARRIGGSQYADDTVVYARSIPALERTLGAVEGEFCLASGARLNRAKTRVLPVGVHAQLPARVAGALVPAGWRRCSAAWRRGWSGCCCSRPRCSLARSRPTHCSAAASGTFARLRR